MDLSLVNSNEVGPGVLWVAVILLEHWGSTVRSHWKGTQRPPRPAAGTDRQIGYLFWQDAEQPDIFPGYGGVHSSGVHGILQYRPARQSGTAAVCPVYRNFGFQRAGNAPVFVVVEPEDAGDYASAFVVSADGTDRHRLGAVNGAGAERRRTRRYDELGRHDPVFRCDFSGGVDHDYRPYSGGVDENLGFLFAANLAVWGGIVFYVFTLMKRHRALRQDLDLLKETLDKESGK